MGKESFRFIHASDFHLERPLQDLPDLPDHLRTALIDAPWKAAESVFEQALVDSVDFILLSGDLVNPVATGAAGPAFLLDHFEELQKHKISVYWAGGQVDDPDRWPDAVGLPSNVHLFSKRQVETVVYRSARDGSDRETLTWHAPKLGFVSVQAEQLTAGKRGFQTYIRRYQPGT